MPPQGAVLAAALAWNYQRSKSGKVTLSQFARRHPAVFVVGWGVLVTWMPVHILGIQPDKMAHDYLPRTGL